ncbi:hypothetical protein [uncultured Pseudoalteromonas sp.]|uniref:hypothetical protein n=1 Tax=uncultured Pseudoalteromonas sp. TaxID=114053 RepID=UPI00259241A4|nr:hypothetical protein [uncultured Pseudoalteromonas sp.]
MVNKIDILKFQGSAILSTGDDIFYARPIGQNDDHYEEHDLMITLLSNLSGKQNHLNSFYSMQNDRLHSWRSINCNYFCISEVAEYCAQSLHYLRSIDVSNVTHEYLSFTYGYIRSVEQLDALWELASENGFEAKINERAVCGHDTARAFYTTSDKIIFSDELAPPNTIGRKQINFPAMKFYNEDYK